MNSQVDAKFKLRTRCTKVPSCVLQLPVYPVLLHEEHKAVYNDKLVISHNSTTSIDLHDGAWL